MKIGLFIPCLQKYDAMGNDVVSMYNILKELDYDVEIFALAFDETIDAKISHVEESKELLNDKNALVIYHHGVYTPFYNDLIESKCKKVFRYHNITYAELFDGYDDNAVVMCRDGREQMKGTVHKFDYFLSCSEFNNNELINDFNVDKSKTFILSPFHRVEDWINIQDDLELKKELYRGCNVNILNVGRLSPNKNHQLLIKGFANYNKLYNNDSVLHIVGKIGPEVYYNEIMNLINAYGISENIIMYTGGISEEKLKTLYENCDLFVMTSKHEGFCVPLVESMYFGLPIVSSAETALKDTVGENGILLNDLKELDLSDTINEVLKYKNEISEIAGNGYDRFSYKYLEDVFITFINKINV